MNKPNYYDEAKAGGAFERVAVGPHAAVILDVKETTAKNGAEMITVSIDFAAEDAQAKYFRHSFDEDDRKDKKWPYQAVSYILVYDSEGKTSRSFKSFCTAFEDSNGVKMQWGNAFCDQFRGKKIGVVYGEVEEEYQGEIRDRIRLRWFCDVHKLDEQKIPEKKALKISAPVTTNYTSDDWMKIPDGVEQLPFR